MYARRQDKDSSRLPTFTKCPLEGRASPPFLLCTSSLPQDTTTSNF